VSARPWADESEADGRRLLERYILAFNRGDWSGMLEQLDACVTHEPDRGEPEVGRDRFGAFLQARARCYLEVLTDVRILISGDGRHAAAEYVISGQYLATDPGMPLARGQRYRLPGAGFFEFRRGSITRISQYRNLSTWHQQLSADS